jgi:predicted Zn-dependent peptidase
LFQNLREQHGYTYGVYSRFGQPNDVSTFRVLTDVAQDHAGDAIQEILTELKRIRTEPISDTELTAAKGLLTGNFALSIEDPADFARQLTTRHLMGLPLDELNNYLTTLEAVTADQALTVAHQYINADQPIIVVVGNAILIKPQLEKLGQVKLIEATSLK